jgi:2-keto-4-pentenoate hydratase
LHQYLHTLTAVLTAGFLYTKTGVIWFATGRLPEAVEMQENTEARRSFYRETAQQLMADHQDGKTFVPFASFVGLRDSADAYAVQREYVLLQQTPSGSSSAGYKVGLTSQKMQRMCGIDSPVSGVILSHKIWDTAAQLKASQFVRVGLEFEIAVRIGRDLRRAGDRLSAVDVARAVDAVGAAIELVDDRGCDYATLEALSLVADNSWNAGIVCGAFEHEWPDLAALEGIVLANGVEIGRGFGADVLGHPFMSLAWLANHLADNDTCLRAGDIVMTGSLIKTQFPAETTQYQFTIEGLGQVSCRISF